MPLILLKSHVYFRQKVKPCACFKVNARCSLHVIVCGLRGFCLVTHMTTARVVTTILRLMPVIHAVYSSDDPCSRHVGEPCRCFSPRVDFSITLDLLFFNS